MAENIGKKSHNNYKLFNILVLFSHTWYSHDFYTWYMYKRMVYENENWKKEYKLMNKNRTVIFSIFIWTRGKIP